MTGYQQFRGTYDARQFRRGQATVSLTAATSGFVTVTFSPAFATIPTVVATARDTNFFADVFSEAAGSVDIYVSEKNSVARTQTVTVNWIALAG